LPHRAKIQVVLCLVVSLQALVLVVLLVPHALLVNMQAQPVLHLLLRPSKVLVPLAKTFLLVANALLQYVVPWVRLLM
jgi:hypothetical protein